MLRRSLESAQYASAEYRQIMQTAGFRASMSRRADCYDNAPMETFFHTLKTEVVHHRQFETCDQAERDIFAYIEGFYNQTRRHSAIDYISPIQMMAMFGWTDPKMSAHYIAQANREKLGISGMDKIIAFDQSQSLDDFMLLPDGNIARTSDANKVVTLRSNFSKKTT